MRQSNRFIKDKMQLKYEFLIYYYILNDIKPTSSNRIYLFQFSGKLLEELLDKTILMSERPLTTIGDLSSTTVQNTFRGPGRLLIEKLDAPGEIIDPATLLIEESALPNDLYDENSDIFSISSMEESKLSILTSNSDGKIMYWLPINICEVNIFNYYLFICILFNYYLILYIYIKEGRVQNEFFPRFMRTRFLRG